MKERPRMVKFWNFGILLLKVIINFFVINSVTPTDGTSLGESPEVFVMYRAVESYLMS